MSEMQWPPIQRQKMNGTAPKDFVIVKVRSSVWVVKKKWSPTIGLTTITS